MTIKNIILDLGGVLLPLNIQATSRAFRQLGAHSFESFYTQLKQDFFFDLFDKGLLSEEGFRQNLKPVLKPDVSDTEIDMAWNAMLGLIPPNRIDFLKQLKQHYQLILLSNTNQIHVKAFSNSHYKQYGTDIFKQLFHHVIYSCNTGMRKPEKEIFDYALQQASAGCHQTIFIDDTIHHINGAQNAGIAAWHLDTATTTVEELLAGILTGNKK